MLKQLNQSAKILELKKILLPLKNNEKIFDIVLYYSSVKGGYNPRDVDIVIIFRSGALRERLALVQDIKKHITKFGHIDSKGILLEELFDQANFARTGVFLEGISLLDGKPFSQKIGFVGSVLFIYHLKNKKHVEKVKFNYVLAGRNGKGIIDQLHGKHIAAGVVEIPIGHSLEFEDVLKLHHINYKIKKVLVEV